MQSVYGGEPQPRPQSRLYRPLLEQPAHNLLSLLFYIYTHAISFTTYVTGAETFRDSPSTTQA